MRGKGRLERIDFSGLLGSLQKGRLPVDQDLREFLTYLGRWETEAPRKRLYRKMMRDGYTVLSSEEFFPEDGGDRIIDQLENTGVLAKRLLRQLYG